MVCGLADSAWETFPGCAKSQGEDPGDRAEHEEHNNGGSASTLPYCQVLGGAWIEGTQSAGNKPVVNSCLG